MNFKCKSEIMTALGGQFLTLLYLFVQCTVNKY